MRIALFHSTLPGSGRKVGGVEVQVNRLAIRLSERGHQVTVFSFFDAPSSARYRHRKLRPAICGRNPLARMIAVPLLLNLTDFSEFDILHLHGDDWFFLRRRIPTVRTFYGSALYEAVAATNWRRRFRQAVTFPLELIASRLATASFSIADHGMPLYRLDGVLPIGVELPVSELAPKSPMPSILFVGTWSGRKRGAFLEQEFRERVLPEHPEAELWMVSDWCRESDRVKWIRFPDDAALQCLYQRAWLFCMPSTYEGFGIPYIEAMANGTPVITTSNPGARYVLADGLNGIIVEDDLLGPTLGGALDNAELRRSMGLSGRRRAEMFSWERAVAEHESAYAQAIGSWR